MRSLTLLLLLAASSASVSAAQAPAPAAFSASAISEWRTGTDGVMRMNLVGDSTAPTGVNVFRKRFPAGVAKDSSKAKVHFHLATMHVLVLRGTLVIGFGDSLNYSKVREYGPEGFVVVPSGKPHYEWTRGDTEIQVEAVGPAGAILWPRPKGPRAPQPAIPDTTTVYPNGVPPWKLMPNGLGIINLAGSTPPSITELVAFRYHFPERMMSDTTRITYHYHYGTEHITILKGTIWFGTGDKLDKSKAKAYGPGSFIENPAGTKHFEWFGDIEAHIEAVGNLGAIDLDPATGQPK